MNTRNVNFVFLLGIGFLLINVALSPSYASEDGVITPDSSSSSEQGEFAGQYYYTYSWYNESFPTWDYHYSFSYWELLWLNNGTEDTWVLVMIDYNLTISDSGNLSYLYFEIYDDPDGSLLTNYEDNWTEFEAMELEGYDEYYVDDNAEILGYEENNTESVSDYGNSDWLSNWEIDNESVSKVDDETASEPSSGDLDDPYSSVENSLTGDEGMWFIDVYFEEWSTTYDGSINYTWYNVDYMNESEIIIGHQLDPANLGPASSSPYDDYTGEDEGNVYWYTEWDWEWAQMMLNNETYNHETYSWTWFSYDIGQWVSFYDNITGQYTFLSQYVGYIGMSLFEDTNGNGVVDVSYYNNEDQNGWNDDVWIMATDDSNSGDSHTDIPYELNVSESEERYLLTLESVENVEWGIPEITDSSAEFWICLDDIVFSAVPYASNYDWFMDDSLSDDLIIDSHVDHLNVSFSFQSNKNGSSISVKHDLADFTDTTNERNPIPAFENLSMTIDYTVYYDKYTEAYAHYDYGEYDYAEISAELPTLDEAIPFNGEIDVGNNDKKLMEMDYTMPYTWGKDGQEYENTVAITPIYGYEWMYSDAEVGQASSFGYESNSYIYSMCFNWEGYAITMDPTFMSFYIDFSFQKGELTVLQITTITLISVLAGFGLVIILKKVRIKN